MAEARQVINPFRLVGATISGKYRIEAVGGQGGQGTVYRATELSLQAPVAIKLLNLGEGVDDAAVARLVDMLRKEARFLRNLSRATTGIVQAHAIDSAEFDGHWSAYLVLEWLEGRTLAEDLSERRQRGYAGRSLAEALDLLEPAAEALGLAHEEGVVHRDLKPENLFLAHVGGRVMLKVLDFGIAEVVRDVVGAGRTAPGIGQRAFTAAYGAPEQFDPEQFGRTGPWTDVYALALTFLEVASGRASYAGRCYQHFWAEAVDLAARPSLGRLGVTAPGEVESVLGRALAVDPRNRFPTAKQFWTKLQAAVRVEPARASPARAATEPSSTPEPRPQIPSRSEVRPAATTTPVTLQPGPARPSPGLQHVLQAAPVGSQVPRWTFAVALGVVLAVVAGVVALRTMASHSTQESEGMVLIPEGKYVIGSSAGDPAKCEAPQRSVYVLSFFIDRTEVSLHDYARCETAGRCTSTKPHAIEQKAFKGLELCNEMRVERGEHLDNNPINCVDRSQAAAYCAFVGKRLPTDDEWEAAARGRRGSEYPWGNTAPSCDKAVFGRPPGNACPGHGTAQIASTPASTSGVFDLAGNVWEWTSTTCPGAPLLGAPAPSAASILAPASTTPQPTDKQEAEIARLLRKANEDEGKFDPGPGSIRGGGFEWSADSLRAWKRIAFPPTQGGVSTGFRCAKDGP